MTQLVRFFQLKPRRDGNKVGNVKARRNFIQTGLLCAAMLQALTIGAQSVIKIASNSNGSLFIKSDGSLWFISSVDQLANNAHFRNQPPIPPKQIVSSNVTAVAAGGFNRFFLKSDGSLWGISNDGTDHPGLIVPSGVKAVATGDNFTIFLKDDGSLWGFGWNNFGQLGDSPELSEFNNDVPKKIVPDGVTAIAAGLNHSLFIKSDGSLWGMGNNISGQLGDGTDKDRHQPEQIVAANVMAVAAGKDHSLFIKSDGSLWAMGFKEFGKLGDGGIKYDESGYSSNYMALVPEQIVASNVTAVAAGNLGSIFLKKDGSLWAMGINWESDYGEGITFDSVWPVQITGANVNNAPLVAGYYYNAALKTTASLWAKSFNNHNQASGGTTGSNIKSELTETNPPGYNLISIQLLSDGNVRISYMGIAGTNYALDRSFKLAPPNWMPQATNSAGTDGVLIFTNMPDQANNNFWRIRSAP
jgi:alpha-tubulin suppressor-like RCC1 family protein